MLKFYAEDAVPTQKEIQNLQSRLNRDLPLDFINAYSDASIRLKYPNEYTFSSTPDMKGNIATIVPFKKLFDEYEQFIDSRNLPDYLPFASDAGGNYILLNIDTNSQSYGHIFFYERDLDELNEAATNIFDFIKGIHCYTDDEISSFNIEEITGIATDTRLSAIVKKTCHD